MGIQGRLNFRFGPICVKIPKYRPPLHLAGIRIPPAIQLDRLNADHLKRVGLLFRAKTLALGILVTICGCVSSPKKIISYFSHPEHGVVSLPNDNFSEDQMHCKKKIYQKGVAVDGHQTIDTAEIDAYITEANVWRIKQIYRIRSAKRAGAIGHAAGLRTAGITIPPILPSDYGMENPDYPPKYEDALRASRDVWQCMENFGWKIKKREIVVDSSR